MDIIEEQPKSKASKPAKYTHSAQASAEIEATASSTGQDKSDQDNSSVAILGIHRLQNDLLAQLFETETNIHVSVIAKLESLNGIVENCSKINQRVLLLVDYRGTDLTETFETLQNQALKTIWFHVALFNVPEGTDLEDFASWPQLSGAFLCNVDQRQLIKGVLAMLDGEIWLPRKLISKYVHKARAYYKPVDGSMEKLTDREIEILKVMRTGARNTEIAESLKLSPHTVKTHVYNIFKKINASNRLQAVNWANEHIPS